MPVCANQLLFNPTLGAPSPFAEEWCVPRPHMERGWESRLVYTGTRAVRLLLLPSPLTVGRVRSGRLSLACGPAFLPSSSDVVPAGVGICAANRKLTSTTSTPLHECVRGP